MKQKFKWLLAFVAMVASINLMWAETAKIIFSSGTNSGSNYYFQANNGTISNVLSFSSAKNSSSGDPAYNSNNSELRMYYGSGGAGGSITITAAEGVTFSGFVLTTSTSPTTKYTADAGTATAVTYSNNVATVTNLSCSSIKIQNCNTTNTQLKIKSIEVTYSGGSTKTLTSIAVSGNPTKTTYETGESFDVTGLAVTGTYSDASTGDVTADAEWTINPATFTSTSQTSVSVTATVDGKTDTKNYDVTVNEFVQTYANTYTSDASLSSLITGSKVKWEGCKEEDGYDALKIAKGGSASITVPAGTKTVHLHLVAWNGESAAFAVKLGETSLSSITPTANTGVANNSPFTLTTEPKTKDSYYFAIDVNADEATTLSLTATNKKRAILFGVNFEADTKPSIEADVEEIEFEQKELEGTVTDSKTISVTGKNLTAVIAASMKSGSAAVFSVTPVGTPTAAEGEFTVSYSTTEAGEYAGTVVLLSGETSIEIPVSASVVAHIPVLQSIYVKGEPTKKEYTVGDAFETDGLEVWGKYDEGEDQQITEGIEWEVTPATFSATTETSVSVVAKALEKTSEAFVVTGLTVAAAPQIATYDFTTNLYGHTGVSSGSDNHDGDIAVNEIFTEAPTQIKFIKSGSTVTRFWSNKGTSELRIYKDAEFTISSTDYNITKVEFAGTVNLKVGETVVSDKTWTGKQKSVTFVNTNTSSALTGITVTYATAAPSAATPTITPSAEAETYWEPITVTLATTTEGAAIYYTIDDTDPTTASTLYENPIAVSATTTIKAIAVKDGLDNSEVATKKFTFGPIFTSLEDLAAADLTKGTTVKVSFENAEIKSIFVTQQGYRNGIYFGIQKGGKDIEIFYQNVPESWVAEGTVSGTMICPWTEYNGTWELAPAANSWNWSNLTYNAPAVTGLTKVEVEGNPSKTTYVDGEKFEPAGLTIYATIDDVRDEYDGSKGEVIYTVTPETLTEGTTSVSVVATIGTISSEAYIVNGLTVNAIQQSTIADFISHEGGRCYLVGEITSAISNGSFTLTDASGSIYVYKHTLNGVTSIAQGDYIKVIADEYEYYNNKTHEAKNVVVIEKPEKPHVDVTGISLKSETTITIGKTETLVATIEPADASDKEVIWTSSNDAIATVAGGVVTAVAEGEAVITVTTNFKKEEVPFTATCTVTVVAAQVKYFALATSIADINAAVTNGKKVVIAPATSETDDVVMGTYASGNNIKAIEADYADERIALEVGEDAFYTIAKDGDYYTFQDGNGKYIYAAGGSSSNHMKAYETLDDKGKWTIEIGDEGVATIKCVNQSTTKNWIRFNNSDATNLIFSCYASGQKDVALYVEAEKPAYVPVESIELNETSAEVMVGKKLTLTATVGPDNATQKGVTWTSDNDKVTVEDGIVTVAADATVGSTATITATTVGTTTEGGTEHLSATCIITVTELVGTKYGLVSNINTLYDGAVVVLGAVYEKNSEMKYAVSGAIGTGKYMASVDVAAADYADEVMLSSGATEITLHKVEGGWTMTSEEGNIYMSGSDIKVSTTQDATVWTISIENGVATIKSGTGTTQIEYNSTDPRFKMYSGQKPIGIYMKNLVAVRTGLTAGKIGTICYPQAIAAVDGATLYQPDYKDYNETLGKAKNIYFIEVAPEDRVAGLPMMFEANGAIIKVLFTGNAVSDPIGNRGMVGNLDEDNIILPQDGNSLFFQNNKLHPSDGTATVGKNRAYIDLANVPAQENQVIDTTGKLRRCAMNVIGGQAPTNLNGLNDNVKAQKVMKDGQFYIIRDTKTYNAQGFEVQ